MKTTKRSPAHKTTKRTPKKATAPKERAAKDAAATAMPKPTGAAKPRRERDGRLPEIGKTITKEWRGKTLEVKCLADGFEFKGATFRSLSAVAKAATGFASVNGFAFFERVPTEPAKDEPSKTKAKRTPSAASEQIEAEKIDLTTAAGQRAALAAAGITKKSKGTK